MNKMMRSMLADSHDKSISSKRVVTLISFTLCCVGFIANLFFKLTVDPNMFNSMMYIVIAGLGFTASEKFATSPNNSNSNNTSN
jgi:hypothetical protein